MNVIVPPFLKSGSTIGVVASARWITEDVFESTATLFANWGFCTKASENLFTKDFQLAGNAQIRREALQKMLDNPDIDAIVIARGGYGTVHIIDDLDFSRFMEKPKWICGYSDITVLHAHLNRMGIATIHSTMPVSFKAATADALENLRKSLTGELTQVAFGNATESGLQLKSSLPVYGGNLSVLDSLLGSPSLEMKGEYYLFVEDVDEMYYHIDRLFTALKRAGILNGARGIILGGMTQMKDNTKVFGFDTENPWGHDAFRTISKIAEDLKIPVFRDFPAGHQDDNRAFYLGIPSTLVVEGDQYVLKFQHH